DTLVQPRDAFAEVVEAPPRPSSGGPTQRPSQISTREALPPRLPPLQMPPPREAGGRGWIVGVVALVLVGGAALFTIGLVGGLGVWWAWTPPERARHARSRPAPDVLAPGFDGAISPDKVVLSTDRGLTFSSIPLGADVYLDRRKMGQTPLIGVKIDPGSHTVVLVSDFESLARTIEVGPKEPTRYVWKGGENWELHK
ncbi:MAG: PEGA domain-containing protein, partial [Myxococcota bacterium]